MSLTLSMALLALAATPTAAPAPPQGQPSHQRQPLHGAHRAHQTRKPAPKFLLAVRPGAGIGNVTLGMPRAQFERSGAKPGFTGAVLQRGPLQASFHGTPPVATTVWVDLAKRTPDDLEVVYDGKALSFLQPPPAIALAFGRCEPVEHLTGNNRVQCQDGHVSVEWNLCPAGLAGPCRDLRVRVSQPTRTAQKRPVCMSYVYGDLYLSPRGVQHLSLRPQLPEGSNVCLGGMPLGAGMNPKQVQGLLPPTCKQDTRLGGSWIRCPGLGVALGFPGPMGGLSVLTLDAKDPRLGHSTRSLDGPSTLSVHEVVASTKPGAIVLWDSQGHPVPVAGKPALTSADVAGLALQQMPGMTHRPAIAVTFTPPAAKRFAALTRRLVDHKLALVVDGCVYSAPLVREAITGGKALLTLPPGEDANGLLDALLKGLPKRASK